MSDQCPVADRPAQSNLIWWQGYSTDETDDEARAHAARKLGALSEHIELERTGGCVLARVKGEAK